MEVALIIFGVIVAILFFLAFSEIRRVGLAVIELNESIKELDAKIFTRLGL